MSSIQAATGQRAPETSIPDRALDNDGYRFWLFGTLALALAPYVWLLASIGRDMQYLVQDDARHFVVWFRRMLDPALFPDDIMADHFDTITPWIYRLVFWMLGNLGMDPLQAQMYVIAPLTGMLFALACYLFIHHFWPCPAGASLASLFLVNVIGWPIGLAHDFAFTGVLFLLLAFLCRRLVTGPLIFAVTGLIPHAAVVGGATMAALIVSKRPPFVSRDSRAWTVLVVAGVCCVAGGLLVVSAAAESGPTFTVSEARSIPFLTPGGFRAFWGPTFASTYLCNGRAGIVPLCYEYLPDGWIFAWTLVVVAVLTAGVFAMRSGLAGRWMASRGLPAADPRLGEVWLALIAAGTFLYAVAHAVLFRIHMPQRYADYTITLVFAMIVAMALAALLLLLLQAYQLDSQARRRLVRGLCALTAAGIVWMSSNSLRDNTPIVVTAAPNIEAFLRSSPKDTLVAGIVGEINSVPAFGSRSVLGSLELLVPYKRHYYEQMASRMTALGTALYAPDASAFAALTARYGIDYILVERVAAEEPIALAEWAAYFPEIVPAVRFLESGGDPFFRARLAECTRASDVRLVLADASCVVQVPNP
jgi:hypothetical protein